MRMTKTTTMAENSHSPQLFKNQNHKKTITTSATAENHEEEEEDDDGEDNQVTN